MQKLVGSRVAVFGIGGVGGHACEALARSGVGALDLVDADRVSESNINRQIVAGFSTLGRLKTEVMEERIRDVNPEAVVRRYDLFFTPENAETILQKEVGEVFKTVLEHAGVFKRDEAGRRAFLRFAESV